jgi:hypothetical protein
MAGRQFEHGRKHAEGLTLHRRISRLDRLPVGDLDGLVRIIDHCADRCLRAASIAHSRQILCYETLEQAYELVTTSRLDRELGDGLYCHGDAPRCAATSCRRDDPPHGDTSAPHPVGERPTVASRSVRPVPAVDPNCARWLTDRPVGSISLTVLPAVSISRFRPPGSGR